MCVYVRECVRMCVFVCVCVQVARQNLFVCGPIITFIHGNLNFCPKY